jgi:endonuclease III related protein
MTDAKSDQIRAYYHTLFSAWGRQHWWPAQSQFEVIVGAYLTQNTSWSNVERALSNLRQARRLSIRGIRRTPLPTLEKLIRSAGYFRQKAQRLKTFVRFLDRRYGGSLTRMFAEPTVKLREELLALNGVGPETADSILLYAGNHPVFVVDAYTRRILERHQMVSASADYHEIQELFERALPSVADEALADPAHGESPVVRAKPRGFGAGKKTPSTARSWEGHDFSRAANATESMPASAAEVRSGPLDKSSLSLSKHPPSRMSTARRTARAQVFNEMHGLLVGVGKNYCLKSQMRCEQCPLQKFLPEKC